jgi:O-methyltransferase
MLHYSLKQLVRPVRQVARRALALPTMEEQQFVSLRGCLYRAAQFAARNYIPGDYLEFGVWEGDSFIKMYHAILSLRPQDRLATKRHPTHLSKFGSPTQEYSAWFQAKPRFFAFDSFAGLPASAEQSVAEEWVEGAYRCSEAQFKRNLSSEGVNLNDVVIVPGFYQETLTPALKQRTGLRSAAIIHVDCDLYESTILVLDFITDLLRQGTVLVFDDWFYNQGRSDLGEQRACREWLARNPQIELIEHWRDVHSISFIVNLPSPRVSENGSVPR